MFLQLYIHTISIETLGDPQKVQAVPIDLTCTHVVFVQPRSVKEVLYNEMSMAKPFLHQDSTIQF